MRDMQADLVALALEHGSPVLAEHLKASAKKHGSAKLDDASLKIVEQAVQLSIAVPEAPHTVGMWFRPMIAGRLKSRHITTLTELVSCCNSRDGSWWRARPRIGVGRARAIVAWLRKHEETIGHYVEADVDAHDPFAAPDSQLVQVGGVAPACSRRSSACPLSIRCSAAMVQTGRPSSLTSRRRRISRRYAATCTCTATNRRRCAPIRMKSSAFCLEPSRYGASHSVHCS
ncbi:MULTISPECIES: phage integrase family protein [unclassified Burkholderia]|uniref:phage integrase family protein n=1 Tax=unclassified Burkholderia TaxID=2613784 RepID=UPI002AB31202|nr:MULTISPECIES: phage integrase family protein [unclassified Burkholderia]